MKEGRVMSQDNDARRLAQYVRSLTDLVYHKVDPPYGHIGLRLAQYVRSLTDFVYHKVDPPYGHIGATIADSVLQANNKYDTHVAPRIQRILKQWPNAKTVTVLLDLLRTVSTATFLNWKGEDRAKRFTSILHLLKSEQIDGEADLQTWLTKDTNLPKLLAINGIGPKTVDYLK